MFNWVHGVKNGMQKTSRILITGSHGFVGKALTQHLREQGYKNLLVPHHPEAAYVINHAKPEYVFHLAGRVRGLGGNINSQYEGFYENLKINTDVIHACKEVGVKKVLAMGTGAIYPPSSSPLSESHVWSGAPHESEYGYAQAKRAMLAQLECSGLKYTYTISGNLYGPGDHFNSETAHVIPSLIYKFTHDEEPVVWGDGSSVRDFVYIETAIRGLRLAMDNIEGPVNLATGKHHSIRDIVTILEQHTGKKAKYNASKPMGQQTRVYDISKLHHLDFGSGTPLEQGVKQTYDFYKSQISSDTTGAYRPPLHRPAESHIHS